MAIRDLITRFRGRGKDISHLVMPEHDLSGSNKEANTRNWEAFLTHMRGVMTPAIAKDRGINPKIIDVLAENGFYITDVKGEGTNRTAFLVQRQGGLIAERGVVKIPKSKVTSVSARMTLGKRDLNEDEADILSRIGHPNIVGLKAVYVVDGAIIPVENETFGVSLEERVQRRGGVLQPKQLVVVTSQLISALQYLHQETWRAHKDVEPSNIIIDQYGSSMRATLTDLQTIGRTYVMKDLHRLKSVQKAIMKTLGKSSDPDEDRSCDPSYEGNMPTRGGTAYTHPDIINAIFSGEEVVYYPRHEFYSLGATMYFALTGKQLFNRTITESNNPSAKKVKICDETVGIELRNEGVSAQKIDVKQHDALVSERLKKVPEMFRDFLSNMLLTESSRRSVQGTRMSYDLNGLQKEDYALIVDDLYSLVA